MFALYAYMRLVDDIADEEDGRQPGNPGQARAEIARDDQQRWGLARSRESGYVLAACAVER